MDLTHYAICYLPSPTCSFCTDNNGKIRNRGGADVAEHTIQVYTPLDESIPPWDLPGSTCFPLRATC